MNETRPVRSRLPSVDQVLRTPSGMVAAGRFGHAATVAAIRGTVAALRGAMRDGAIMAPDPGAIAAERTAAPGAGGCPEPAARVQSHGHGAAHQPRPRAAAGSRDRGRGGRHALGRCAGVRRRRSRARRARRPRARPRPRADRRGGRLHRQQQCRRRAPGAQHLRRRQGGHRLARRADRDRRLVPAARHHGARRRPPRRSGHHKPHAPQGLRVGDRREDRPHPQGAYIQLPDPGLHEVGAGARACRAWRGQRASPSSTTWAREH